MTIATVHHPFSFFRRNLFPVLLSLCLLLPSLLQAGQLRLAGEAMIESPAWSWNMAPWDSEKVISYGDYQYTVYWDANKTLTLARRHIATNDLQRIRFPDATLPDNDDPHQSTAIGISPQDGRLHLSYRQWASTLRYRSSVAGFLDNPPATLSASDFTSERSMVSQQENQVTYPRFFNLNDGTLLFIYRHGTSQNGDHFLNRYNGQTGSWERIGMLFSRAGTFADPRIGTSTARCAYLNDVLVDANNRIHISWTWREGSGHQTNHDLHYIYSDDEGLTWKNNSGRTVANLPGGIPVRVDSLGIVVAEIATHSWLINQDTMVVDSRNQPHVVTHHAVSPTLSSTERNIHFIHYWREAGGQWRSRWITSPENHQTSFRRRGALAIDPEENLHFLVLEGGLRYFHARADQGWSNWSEELLGSGFSGQGLRYDRRLWEKNQVLYSSATRSSNNAYLLPIFHWDRPGPRWPLGMFEEPGNLEEWRLEKHLQGEVNDEDLHLTFQGNDPYLRRGGLGIDADRYRYLLLRMSHLGAGAEGAVFFVTHDDFTWSYNKSRTFPLAEPNGTFHDYLIDLGAHSRWRGGVAALRIDPVENALSGDTATIERIVLLERHPFEEWRRLFFNEDELADSTISGAEANPAGDGVNNLMKHALGLDPRRPAYPAEMPRVSRFAEGIFLFTYKHPKETGLRYRIEVSSDLEDWYSGPGHTEVVAVEDLGDRERVTIRDAAAAGAERRFIRLRVEK